MVPAVDFLVELEHAAHLPRTHEVEIGIAWFSITPNGSSAHPAHQASEVSGAADGREDVLQGAIHLLIDLGWPERAVDVHPIILVTV